MPYTAPSTVSAGQTYASAAHNVIVNDIIDHESRLLTVQNTQYPFRNILLNGAMQVSQRATSVSGSTTGGYLTADRWYSQINSLGTWTNAISADAPTGSGFRNSFRLTATASAVTSSGSYAIVSQRLEGQTLQHLKKGTSSAQQLTLSFWVKSNKTGTYISDLYDNNNNRQVGASYTINAADTWESKTITFPADTTGVFTNDSNFSLSLSFWLGAGTDYTSGSLNTSWNTSTNANRAVGQTNLAGATNQYLAITGVQLEPGNVASPYEFVLYQDELRRCQRYYWKMTAPVQYACLGSGYVYATSGASFYIKYPTTMRGTPNLVTQSGMSVGYANSSTSVSAVSSAYYGSDSMLLVASTAAVLTIGQGVVLYATSAGSNYVDVSAEL